MKQWIHPKESQYYMVSLVISVLMYIALVFSGIGIIYIISGAVAFLFMHGMLIGSLKGNGVKVSDRQFPQLYQSAARLSKEMGLAEVPDMYLLQSGGALNAFATRFLGRDFVVLYSDVLELAYEKGPEAVEFILCHELAHVQQKHVSKRTLLLPSTFVPFLGTAYSRACEYTCDMIAANLVPQGAVPGLLVLAGGKKLHRYINAGAYVEQGWQDTGFWTWFAEINGTHPFLCKRLGRLLQEVPATHVNPVFQSGEAAV